MRNYSPMRLPPMGDRVVRSELRRLDNWLRQLGPQMGRVIVTHQGTPSIVTQEIDLTNFLYLPGRQPFQRSLGNVTFDTDGNLISQPLDSIVGLALKATQAAGNTTTIYFNTGDSGQNYIGRWTFPITGTTPSDNTFVEVSAGQALTNKTIGQGSVIIVGTGAQRVTFRDIDSGTKEFFIDATNSFPSTGVMTPSLKLPALNTSIPLTDRHSFMMLNASITAPFVTGSIAHGNHDGSEMQMLPTGGNGRALRFNVGETVAATSWTNGGTTITGTFDTTKTRPGMRVRGNSGSAVYVDENTMIVTASAVQITVDTPLVGNNVATVTVQTWGPTWDFELSGVAHGSLTGLTNDDHPQYLYLAGRAGGQVLGSGSHTSANLTDLTIEGRLMLGDGLSGVNYTAGRALDIRSAASNGTTFVSIQNTANTPASGAASGTLTMLLVQPNSPAYTSGSYTFRGLNFTMTGNPAPSGVTVTALTAIFAQTTPSEGGDPGSGGTFGSISNYRGIDISVQGTSVPANRTVSATTNGTTALTSAGLFVAPIAAGQVISKADVPSRTTIVSITDASNLVMSNAATGSTTSSTAFLPISSELILHRMASAGRQKPLTNASYIQFNDSGTGSFYVTNANLLEVNATVPFNTAGVGTWSLIRMDNSPSLPVVVWAFNISGVANSRHAGNFSIGATATPTAKVHLGAGTTAASTAPLKFTSGTSMTTAEAGALEFTTDDFFATITTGTARKAFVLDDGARLTSGKYPKASTNGRLIDGPTPLAGTKVYFVADSSGGAVTRKLTFTDGILTAET